MKKSIHATVKIGDYTIPLIGVDSSATQQKCCKCGQSFHLSDIVLDMLGNPVCHECAPKLDFEERFPFQGATIRATFWSDKERKWSDWRVENGKLKCTNPECEHVAEDVLPVFGLPDKPPTNYVCALCRGLLEPAT